MATNNSINNSLASGTGLPISTGITGLGTGIATALAVNTGSAGAPVLFNGALGTPSSGTLTNCTFPTLNQNSTGSAASLSISGQTGLLTFVGLASTNRAKTIRDAADTILELGGSYTPTGTWTSLTMVTPVLGAATATSVAIGTLSYSPANPFFTAQSSVNTFNQNIIQNTNAGNTASSDFVVNNDQSTDTTFYGDFGMNGSGFTGAPLLSTPNHVFLTATSAPLDIGTTTAHGINFVVNNANSASMNISSAGVVGVATGLTPIASDGAALGTTALMWSDLFLASGAVVNFNNGDVLITHSANTLAFTGAASGYTYDSLNIITSASSTSLAVGATGTTNPAFVVDSSTASSATGVSIKSAAAAGKVALSVVSSGTDEGLLVDAKGAGTIRLGATSTGAVEFSRNAIPTANDGSALGTTALSWADLFLASGGVINHNSGSSTITGGTNIWTFGGSGANGNGIVLPTGGTSIAPLNIPAGTLKTTAGDGDIEMDGNAFYACTDAGNRGVIPVEHLIRQHADRATFANNANQQAIFDSVTNGTLTLETGAYLFEAVIQCKGMSGTSGNLKFSLVGAGGGTFTVILYATWAVDSAVNANANATMTAQIVSTQTVTDIATATTATVCTVYVKGSFECTVAGTLIPSIAQTTAINNSATITAGSYFKCNRIGATTVTNVGQWT